MKNIFGVATHEDEINTAKESHQLPMDDHDFMVSAFLEYCYWNDKYERYRSKRYAAFARRALTEVQRLSKLRIDYIRKNTKDRDVRYCPTCGMASDIRNYGIWHIEGDVCRYNGKPVPKRRHRR